MLKGLYKEGYTQNREISWLRFDDRVLNEAKDETVPLLERMKSVYFFTSNLTEFFRVRVGSLIDLSKAKYTKIDNKSGLSPKGQLDLIYPTAKRDCAKRDKIYADLLRQLAKAGVEDVQIKDCSKKEMKFLRDWYREKCSPLLTPQIVDTHHPFPNLQNHITYIACILKYKGHGVFGFVPIPSVLPAVIILPHKSKVRFVHTEDLVQSMLEKIFPDAEVTEAMKITVARSAYVDPQDDAFDDIADYRKKMEKVLKERRRMNVTMLTCSRKPSRTFRNYLLSHLKITQRELFVCTVPTNLKYVFSLEKVLDENMKASLIYNPYTPKLSPALDYKKSLFDQIQEKDVLLSYPYESMQPFLQLVREAANDENVLSISITIYRLANKARLVDYLCMAAENGKQVNVLIELKARFDEQNNIDYSERLEDAGCNVTYGFETYKVHSKICLITRVKDGKTQHAALIATGNFNENTAKSYTDLALMTSKAGIIRDAIAFFKNMSMGKLDGSYRSLLVAPVSLKPTLLDLIEKETAKKDKGYIFAKVNAVTDEEIMAKLSEASNAGVKVQLLVRGISCILPGIAGHTENIEIRSIVGRYLEHSRIYVFGNGTGEKMYISSADFMTRNTERRVEIACPVNDKDIRKKIHGMIDILWKDNVKARILAPNGRYHKFQDVEVPFNAQNALMRMTNASEESLEGTEERKPAVVSRSKYKRVENA